jgi:hypothetical protein
MKSLHEYLDESVTESKATFTAKEMDKICKDQSNIKKIANEIGVPEDFVKDVLGYISAICHDTEKYAGITNQSKEEFIDYLKDEDEFVENCMGEYDIYNTWGKKIDLEDKLAKLGNYFADTFLQ